MIKIRISFLVVVLSLCFLNLKSQNDSLIFDNGNVVVGEVKEMIKGVLRIETDYSDSDFEIEWEKIRELYSDQLFTLSLMDKSIWTRAKLSSPKPGELRIEALEGIRNVSFLDVVYIRELHNTFISKLSTSVDIGYSITKANNLRQYTARASLRYKEERWILRSIYDQVESTQDDVDKIRRTEVGITSYFSLRKGTFLGAGFNFLSNTEQRLKLRTTATLGAGYYLAISNSLYWTIFVGGALNSESFNNDDFNEDDDSQFTPNRESAEAVIGTDLNLYDIGDLNLMTQVYWFPSFTEKGRNRFNVRFDLKYDLPLDFYVRTGITYNYDSQPANGASTTDYVWQSGFGWEL